ncbi:MAG TPA: hypothetical protein VH308_04430 [Terracidiphilus sp.]|nr:hypothetical protein [Terracidiphilus sp.]
MSYLKAVTLVLVLLPTLAIAEKKPKKPSVPAAVGQAHNVYVEAVGGEEFNPNLLPPDRIAIADLRDALHAWGRYTFTADREKADIVFVVHKGRRVSAGMGGGMGNDDDQISRPSSQGGGLSQSGPRGTQNSSMQFPGEQQREPGVGLGSESNSEDDVLRVYQLNANGKLTGPLWIHSMPNGLSAPRMLLFKQFKDAVEKEYPQAPAAAPSPSPAPVPAKP